MLWDVPEGLTEWDDIASRILPKRLLLSGFVVRNRRNILDTEKESDLTPQQQAAAASPINRAAGG